MLSVFFLYLLRDIPGDTTWGRNPNEGWKHCIIHYITNEINLCFTRELVKKR